MMILASVRAKSGQGELVKTGLQALVEPSRAEAGCGRYELFATNDPDVLLVLEEWQDQAALDAHMATAHFQAFVAEVGEALGGPPEITPLTPLR